MITKLISTNRIFFICHT